MKIESKISGWAITDYDLSEFKNPFAGFPFVYLDECLTFNQNTMDFILDTLRFHKAEDNRWITWIDHDTLAKIAILEKYPNYETELIEYFGKDWVKFYLRFNH